MGHVAEGRVVVVGVEADAAVADDSLVRRRARVR